MCKESLSGPAVIAYADTLIELILILTLKQTVIWVKQVDQPEAYGVVKLNDANEIVELVENRKTSSVI
jgi:glucose-1-phosphate thymidylyltransferase